MIHYEYHSIKVVSRKMEKVHMLEDNCEIRKIMDQTVINTLPLSYYCKLHMNQQSPEHQLINRLNNSGIKFNLCIYIISKSLL